MSDILLIYGLGVFFSIVFLGWGMFKIRDKISVVDLVLVVLLGLFSWFGLLMSVIAFKDELDQVIIWKKQKQGIEKDA